MTLFGTKTDVIAPNLDDPTTVPADFMNFGFPALERCGGQ
ncbi:hypothetical protein M2432_002113 [Mycobacterium sp. OTB74]|jgi:hypothetical protein|nr:hypothetical protein [Mycobacterium sp. OTB74]